MCVCVCWREEFSSYLTHVFSLFLLFILQVKVWFQNRRTKHKRMQQEGDSKGDGDQSGNNDSHSYDDEDEMIDMEMDDCSSDDEHGIPH